MLIMILIIISIICSNLVMNIKIVKKKFAAVMRRSIWNVITIMCVVTTYMVAAIFMGWCSYIYASVRFLQSRSKLCDLFFQGVQTIIFSIILLLLSYVASILDCLFPYGSSQLLIVLNLFSCFFIHAVL